MDMEGPMTGFTLGSQMTRHTPAFIQPTFGVIDIVFGTESVYVV